jgi:hypothetical protein
MGRYTYGWSIRIYEPDRACRRASISDLGIIPQLSPFGICRDIFDILRDHQLDEGPGICRPGAIQQSEYDVDGRIHATGTRKYLCRGLVGKKSVACPVQRDHQPIDDRRWTRTYPASHLVMALLLISAKAPSASGDLPSEDGLQSLRFRLYRPGRAATAAFPAVGGPTRGHGNEA